MVGDRFSFQYRRYYNYIQPILADPVIRSYFSLIASFLLVAFLVVFALSPTINTILGLRKKIDDQRAIVAALDQKSSQLLAANEVYAQVQSLVPLLDEALPPEPSPQKIISDVNTVASGSGVILSGLQFQRVNLNVEAPEASPEASPLAKLEFSFAVSGSKSNIRTFLANIENVLHYIRVKSMVLGETETASVFRAEITSFNYYLP